MDVKQAVEALLFSCDTPLSAAKLHELVPDSKPAEIRDAINAKRASCGMSGFSWSTEVQNIHLAAARSVPIRASH
jgi:chromosome segregation and condensation protein ScpB